MNTETAYRFKVSNLEYFVIKVDGEPGVVPFFLVRVVATSTDRGNAHHSFWICKKD